MKKVLLATSFAFLPALAFAGTIPGGEASNCSDPNAFEPVMSVDGETVLYWNNPTCGSGRDMARYVDILDDCGDVIRSYSNQTLAAIGEAQIAREND